jgi:signal transduction histidine kinase/ActR/RegA family two-component response regulator
MNDSAPPSRLPWIVLAGALLVTGGITRYVVGATRARDRARFDAAVQEIEVRIRSRLDTCVAILLGAGGLPSADGDVQPERFRAYVERLDLGRRLPGIQAVGFSRRVGDKHAVVLVVPLDRRNHPLIGSDMSSDPVRRQAMERARDTGQPAASALVALGREGVAGEDRPAGFLLYVPVYRGGRTPETVAERRAGLVGFVHGAFRAADLFEGIGGDAPSLTAFSLRDGDDLLYASPRPAGSRPRHRARREVELAGRRYALAFASRPGLEAASGGSLVVQLAGAGLLLSGLLFWMVRGFLIDLGERRRVEAALRESEERAKAALALASAADRRKDEFLAMLGHELRNPLAPILTAIELLNERGDRRSQHERHVIERQVRHMVRLVDDLLDISRITRGKIELKKTRVELRTLVDRGIEMASPLFEQRAHQLNVQVPRTGLPVVADQVRLAQVISNLLTNAAKYTPPQGHVSLTARREGDTVVLSVKDDGAGIPKEMLGAIFDLFVQGERTIDRGLGGLGIGLTLARNLVERHGGTITASSDGPGQGSEFLVRLPAAPAEEVRDRGGFVTGMTQPMIRVGGRRVMLVDDNEDAVELLAAALMRIGHDVAVAYDAPNALAVARTFHPEVALLDIGLPVMDGYELARRLRELLGPSVRLVAVTGYGQEHDRVRAEEAGFAEHLVKPVSVPELAAAIAGPRREEEATATPA